MSKELIVPHVFCLATCCWSMLSSALGSEATLLWLLRTLSFVGGTLMLGGSSFAWTFATLQPAAAQEVFRTDARSAVRFGAACIVICALPMLLLHAHGAAPSSPDWLSRGLVAVFVTWWGPVWLLQVGATLVVALLLGERTIGSPWLIAIETIVVLTLSPTGHALAVVDPNARLLALAAAWLHLLAIAVWLGGVMVLAHALPTALSRIAQGDRAAFAREALARFSQVAIPMVSVMMLTGLYAMWLHMPGLRTFAESGYGKTLLVKIVVVGSILYLGSRHFVAGRSRRTSNVLYNCRTLTFEAVLALAAIAISAFLVGQAPPGHPVLPTTSMLRGEAVEWNLRLAPKARRERTSARGLTDKARAF
jgi:putative copper export protein